MLDTQQQVLHQLIRSALQEDIGEGDHSTLSSIPSQQQGKAVLRIKQAGILAGMEVAVTIFQLVEPDAVFTAIKKDGDAMQVGEAAFEVTAKVHTILQCERLVLNCMQRMSGIATLTKSYTDLLKGVSYQTIGYAKDYTEFSFAGKRSGAYWRRREPSFWFV